MKTVPFKSSEDVLAVVDEVRTHLDRGGLLVHPTETVYGLGAKPEAQSISRMNRAKERDESQPVLLLIAGIEMLESWGISLPPSAQTLAKAFARCNYYGSSSHF